MKNFDSAAKALIQMTLELRESSSERLDVSCFSENDHYKVRYRFICNMLSKWEQLGLDEIPTEGEAIEIAKVAHPYFEWLFKDEEELEGFKSTYEFHYDIFKGYK